MFRLHSQTTKLISYLHVIAAILLCCRSISLNAQKEKTVYNQFWQEFTFTKTFKGKWAGELNMGTTWTSAPPDNSIFYRNSQIYGRLWIHYFHSARWKFSAFYAYYFNRSLPEINQKDEPELRSAVQAIYYFKRRPFTVTGRMRLEDRHFHREEGYYEAVYRARLQAKGIFPINSQFIRKGTIYGIVANEVFFKTKSNVAGSAFFDRNRLTLGTGYSVTDDFQIEFSYVNEQLPRPESNSINVYNALQLNFSFNNLLPNLKKKFHKDK